MRLQESWPYEPWVLHVGQTVRVRISAECRSPQAIFIGDDLVGLDWRDYTVEIEGHLPVEDGQIGVILDIEPYDPESGRSAAQEAHRVLVEFAPFTVPGVTDYPQECLYYAVIELEPL